MGIYILVNILDSVCAGKSCCVSHPRLLRKVLLQSTVMNGSLQRSQSLDMSPWNFQLQRVVHTVYQEEHLDFLMSVICYKSGRGRMDFFTCEKIYNRIWRCLQRGKSHRSEDLLGNLRRFSLLCWKLTVYFWSSDFQTGRDWSSPPLFFGLSSWILGLQ